MKKLLLMLLITSTAVAQEDRLNLVVNTDYAVIKEQKLNVGVEVEMEMKYFYAKLGAENFALPLNYFDVHGGLGGNYHFGMYEKNRIYGGLRLGKIWREDRTTVPLFGYELGYQRQINDWLSIRGYGTYDYRTEGDFLGYPRFYRFSGKIAVVIKIKNLKK